MPSPGVEQKHVPMALWQGPQARAQAACIAAQRNAALTHNLFHSTLGLLGIGAAEYGQSIDAFAACRAL